MIVQVGARDRQLCACGRLERPGGFKFLLRASSVTTRDRNIAQDKMIQCGPRRAARGDGANRAVSLVGSSEPDQRQGLCADDVHIPGQRRETLVGGTQRIAGPAQPREVI